MTNGINFRNRLLIYRVMHCMQLSWATSVWCMDMLYSNYVCPLIVRLLRSYIRFTRPCS